MASEAVGSGSIPLGTTSCKVLILSGLELKNRLTVNSSEQCSNGAKMRQNAPKNSQKGLQKDYKIRLASSVIPAAVPFVTKWSSAFS
jgi:hypothetical protein